MKMRQKLLTNSEEELMNLFWEWNGNYVHMMLRSLLAKGMIEVCGVVQCGTQYARQFVPAVTKEQYAAKIVAAKEWKVTPASIAAVTVALANEVKAEKRDIIKELEEIIDELKHEDTERK